MTDLLEQMKTRAEQAQTAYEAYKAECDKAQELPEVWYLYTDGDCGQHFGAGESTGILWNHETDKETSHTRRFSSRSESFTACTAAEYNNARALYHGADFTGRLHEIDRPVCELNKATRDEIGRQLWCDIEFKVKGANGWTQCTALGVASIADISGMSAITVIYRLRAPKKRPMTRKEVLAWASSEAAFGWVVRMHSDDAVAPQWYTYPLNHLDAFTRARITTLNDDGTGGEWEAFEVQA